jgi:hypothetical protein
MLDIKKKYQEAKTSAIDLMKNGRLTEYIAQLATVEQLKLQLINANVSNATK